MGHGCVFSSKKKRPFRFPPFVFPPFCFPPFFTFFSSFFFSLLFFSLLFSLSPFLFLFFFPHLFFFSLLQLFSPFFSRFFLLFFFFFFFFFFSSFFLCLTSGPTWSQQLPGLLMVSMGLSSFMEKFGCKSAHFFVTLKTMSRVVPEERLISSRDSYTPRRPCCDCRVVQRAFLSTTPANPLTRIDSFVFRTLFCHRLRLAIPSTRICRCGRTIDPHGHHRVSCARSGFGSSGICNGECGRPRVSGRWRPCCHEQNDSKCWGFQAYRSHCGWLLVVRGAQLSMQPWDGLPREGVASRDGVVLTTTRATCHWHHPRECHQEGRDRKGRCSHHT